MKKIYKDHIPKHCITGEISVEKHSNFLQEQASEVSNSGSKQSLLGLC